MLIILPKAPIIWYIESHAFLSSYILALYGVIDKNLPKFLNTGLSIIYKIMDKMSYCHTGSVLIYDFIPMRSYGIIKLAVDFCRSRSFLNEGEVDKWNYFNSLILD